MRVGSLDDGRFHEPSHRLVALAAHHHLGIVGSQGEVDVALALVEAGLVDDGVHEVHRVAHVAHLDFCGHALHVLQHRGPQALRNVHTAGSRALLALELEGATEGSRSHRLGVGRGMHEDEVLATRLAHQSRVAHVAVEVGASLAPEALEGCRGTREVNTGEVLALGAYLADEGTAARQEVHDAVGQAGFLVELHQVVVREQRRRRRLPHGHVTHQHGRHAQVRGDAREVERCHGQHETFQRTVLRVVDIACAVLRLHGIDLRSVVDVVAEEVDGLAGRVDFCLVEVLALPEHTGSVHDGTILRCQQLCHLQDDAGAHGPVRLRPFFPGLHRRLYGQLHFLLADLVVGGEHVLVVVGAGHGARVARADFLTADDDRDVHDGVALALEFCLEGDTFG